MKWGKVPLARVIQNNAYFKVAYYSTAQHWSKWYIITFWIYYLLCIIYLKRTSRLDPVPHVCNLVFYSKYILRNQQVVSRIDAHRPLSQFLYRSRKWQSGLNRPHIQLYEISINQLSHIGCYISDSVVLRAELSASPQASTEVNWRRSDAPERNRIQSAKQRPRGIFNQELPVVEGRRPHTFAARWGWTDGGGERRTPRLAPGGLNQDVIDLLKRSLLSCWALFKCEGEEMDTICHFLLFFSSR